MQIVQRNPVLIKGTRGIQKKMLQYGHNQAGVRIKRVAA